MNIAIKTAGPPSHPKTNQTGETSHSNDAMVSAMTECNRFAAWLHSLKRTDYEISCCSVNSEEICRSEWRSIPWQVSGLGASGQSRGRRLGPTRDARDEQRFRVKWLPQEPRRTGGARGRYAGRALQKSELGGMKLYDCEPMKSGTYLRDGGIKP